MLKSVAASRAIDIDNGGESSIESTRVKHREVPVVVLEWNRRTGSLNWWMRRG